MYALFYEDSNELVGLFDRKLKALAMARVSSREKGRVVVAIYNGQEGMTQICFKFDRGIQTYDGGCCSSTWTVPPPAGLPTAEGQKAEPSGD